MESIKEVWRPITGFEDAYEVSNLGNVRSLDRHIFIKTSNQVCSFSCRRYKKGKLLRQSNRGRGYMCVNLSHQEKNKIVNTHKLVAEAFLSVEGGGLVVNHKDGDKTNNSVANLEWVTTSENHLHAVNTLGQLRGDTHGMAKITENEVLEIQKRCQAGEPATSIAKDYNIGPSQIKRIRRGDSWKHLKD